jgi:hypothetical protein
MGQRLTAFVLFTLATAAPAWPADPQVRTAAALATLAFFQDQAAGTTSDVLARLRPDPLDEASRAQVMASLPQGELRPTTDELAKIAAAERVLDYSARLGVISIRVIDLGEAFIGLYYRTVILVSRPQLAILNADEFAALVAHEVGHDYDWNLYWDAMKSQDHARRRELELRADGLAVLTLRGVGLDPERLVTAVQRTLLDNRGKDPFNWENYVGLPERVAFIHAMMRLNWAETPRAAVSVDAGGPRN